MDTTAIDNLFSAVTASQSQQATVAKYALANAAGLLQSKKYPEAIVQLKRSLALDPYSEDAYNTLGSVYLQLNKTKEAIDTYKRLLQVAPTSADAYNSLGNAYLQAGKDVDAEKAYKTAARMDPSSSYAPYTLGNMYERSGRLAEARQQFADVVRISPRDAHGYFGLALVHNKEGNYDEAVAQAQKSIALDKKLGEGYFELAVAYMGLERKDDAQEQLSVLKELDAGLAFDLQTMLSAPKIAGVLPSSKTFNTVRGPGTLLSSLDAALLLPNTSKDFTMVFQFAAPMDPSSVMDVNNWSISKAAGGTAGLYNNGVTPNPEVQVTVPSLPRRVVYDPDKMQATVFFTLYQNSLGNAEIDPSHIVFKFSGADENGKALDPSADEYAGFAGVPF